MRKIEIEAHRTSICPPLGPIEISKQGCKQPALKCTEVCINEVSAFEDDRPNL
jgi:hypothetical protein